MVKRTTPIQTHYAYKEKRNFTRLLIVFYRMLRHWILSTLVVAFSVSNAFAADDFLLTRNCAGKLCVGMPESTIYRVYAPRMTKKVEIKAEGNPAQTVQIFFTEDRKVPSLIAHIDIVSAGTEAVNSFGIWGIDVVDSRFKTKEGIGIGSTLGELRAIDNRLSFVGDEGLGAVSKNLNMTFSLAPDADTLRTIFGWLYDPNEKADRLTIIPTATKIRSVWVFWTPEAAAAK